MNQTLFKKFTELKQKDNQRTGKRQDQASHSSTAEGSNLLGYDTVLLCQQLLTFQRTVLPSTSRPSIHCWILKLKALQ
jgi:hypothetical protein